MAEKKEEKKKQPAKIIAIVAAADFNEPHFMSSFQNNMFSYIIAVDAGFKHLDERNIVPNLVIGDFDSLGYTPKESDKPANVQLKTDVENKTLKPMEIMQYPCNKDKTDLELAIDEALSKKPQIIMLYGAMGQRFDQTFSSIQMLSHIADHRVGIFCVGIKESCVAINGPSEFGLGVPNVPDIDKTISVFSLSDVSLIDSSQGLKWPYVNTALTSAMSLGASNEIVAPQMKMKVKQGKVLLIFSSELLIAPKKK